MASCGGGGNDAPPPAAALPSQNPSGTFDPGPAGTPADVVKAHHEAAANAMKRGIKQEEFLLTLVADPSVEQLDAINIDVISATAAEVAKLEQMGPVKYRDSRHAGANTRTHVFNKGGMFEVKVPTIPATDTILLWAELEAPANGNDSRMLMVPLVLDKSDPAKGPLANPITVKLTANGWVRES